MSILWANAQIVENCFSLKNKKVINMTRKEAQQIALKEIEEGIRQEGEDAVFMMSP